MINITFLLTRLIHDQPNRPGEFRNAIKPDRLAMRAESSLILKSILPTSTIIIHGDREENLGFHFTFFRRSGPSESHHRLSTGSTKLSCC